jgi:hypothetical protein
VAAAGDGCADVGIGVLDRLLRSEAEKFFAEIGAAGDAKFFRDDAEGVFAGDEMDAGDTVIGFKGAQKLASEDCAGGAGDGDG